MNVKTTVALLLLVVGLSAAYFLKPSRPAAEAAGVTNEFLEKTLTAKDISKIEVSKRGKTLYALEKVGGEWTLPGKWPVRASEAARIVEALTSLRSRFAPTPLAPSELEKAEKLDKYGLGDDALVVAVTSAGKTATLKLGEESSESNRFSRATFVQLDKTPEVVRLGPGVLASLERNQEYFQQRRLFTVERVAKDDVASEKVEQVSAQEIRIKGPDGDVTIAKKDGDWVVVAPVSDRVDPDKLKSLLRDLGDLWADRFVSSEKKIEETGLDKAEYLFRVVTPKGADLTVLIGKISESKERIITKPSPPASPFAPPPKPNIQIVKEEFRYAKLPDNAQLFEVKTDKLKDLAVALADLRDARVARFRADDVRKVTIEEGGKTLVFAKVDDKWRIESPALDAESQPLTELLDKLSGLEARGGDVRDKEEAKAVGLDAPAAKVTLALEESPKKKSADGAKDEKVKRTLVYRLGTSAKEKEKVFVQLEGWPRVNVAKEEILKLAQRDVLAYRSRRALDVAAADVARVGVTRGGETFVFEKKSGAWSLTQPAETKVELSKVERLVDDLARLEATEYVAAAPKAEELDKTFGLAKPTIEVVVGLADAKKPAKTLRVGKQRAFKDEWFARVDDGPVLAIRKDLFETLDRDSLAYRPAQAWQVAGDKIAELRIRKEGQAYVVAKADKNWKISGPFDALARPEYVDAMSDELAQLKSEKYVAQAVKDLAKFGLDKPYLQFDVVVREPLAEEKKDDAKGDKKDDAKKAEPKTKDTVLTLQVGKRDEAGKARFARVGTADAIFLVADKALDVLDRGALDLLDRTLVELDVASVDRVQYQGAASFSLEKKKDAWQVVGSPAAPFAAEEPAVQATLRPWGKLLAEKYVAYGPKVDWAAYGLDAPALRIAVSVPDKDKKATERTLALGKETANGERYARLDQQQAVVTLPAGVAKDLARTHVDFVDPRVLKFAFDAVASVERKMKDGDFELTKQDDAWRFAKPTSQSADALVAEDVVEKTFQLRAKKVVAYPAKDLAKYGLDAPTATVTLVLQDGKKHVIKVGSLVDKGPERHALVEGTDRVIVLGAELSKHLSAPTLYFADRNLASFGGADRIDLVRGDRKATFVKAGSAWKMAEPLKADAEDSLGDLLQAVLRLRADEIVAAGKEVDLKKFGLDAPVAQWRFLSGENEKLGLIVGAEEKGTKRRYAKLAKGDAVFLVAGKLADLVVSEPRSRKPWETPLDAAQVEQLAVVGPAGNFTLKKREGNWSALEKLDAAVAAKTVTDTLDCLAGLKAERYVADAKGDLKLHGLVPPLWKFEAKTPTGTRTLLIGRSEGDSARVYAAAEGSDAIFVVSGDDARRLIRPLTVYLETK